MPAYDEVAEAYSRTLDPEGAGLADPILSELIGDVAGRDVLSLACGQGQDARLLARLGATVTGIDISVEMLRTLAGTKPPSGVGSPTCRATSRIWPRSRRQASTASSATWL